MKTELKIEVGKFYKDRVGRKVRIYATDGLGDYPIHGARLHKNVWCVARWTRKGKLYIGETHPDDIVSEWVAKHPRNGEPAWATHRVMFMGGNWYWCSNEPVGEMFGWSFKGEGVLFGVIPPSHAQPFTGDWKDSLQELE